MKLRLFSPFLLKRLVRAQERQAAALEELINYVSVQSGRAGKTIEEHPESETDLLYATDEATFYKELVDSKRLISIGEETE